MQFQSISAMARQIRAGELDPVELVEQCLAKIKADEPQVQAWVLVDELGARSHAKRLASEAATGDAAGRLCGIPIAIKDIVDVADWPTKAGSPLRDEHQASEDAVLVQRLRREGAILLGKTVTTEFACFDPPPTANPRNLAHTPGGSSSGSAAAVAAEMCVAAIGSQTGGSITRPAGFCGVAGWKPTFGAVPVDGVVPVSFHLDHPGPLGRSVEDVFEVCSVLADWPWQQGLFDDVPIPKIGVLEEFFLDQASEEVAQATRAAIDSLQAAGAEITTVAPPPSFAEVKANHWLIMAVDGAAVHRDDYPARAEMFGEKLRGLLEFGRSADPLDYSQALRHQLVFQEEMRGRFAGLDALLTPATVTTAPAISEHTTGDPSFNAPWSYAGLPTVTFPCAKNPDGLPIGLQLIGEEYQEAELARVASWCARAIGDVL